MTKWRIALLQMAPELGQIEKNRRKLLALTSKLVYDTYCRLPPGELDLLCLPEMVLTGYAFPSAESIKPYLEQPRIGPTSRCCSDLAKRLRCHVMAGFPESLSHEEDSASEGAVGYNSAMVYGPDGEWRGGYRKTNLFHTDMTWARPGNGFGLFDLGTKLGRVSLGICMDLNPQPPAIWTSTEGPYELASFALNNNTQLLVILCAWLDSREHPEEYWDHGTLEYWMARLQPLWKRQNGQPPAEDTIVAICNRTGMEGDTVYGGTSTIFRFSHKQDAPEIIGLMRRDEQGARIWEVT